MGMCQRTRTPPPHCVPFAPLTPPRWYPNTQTIPRFASCLSKRGANRHFGARGDGVLEIATLPLAFRRHSAQGIARHGHHPNFLSELPLGLENHMSNLRNLLYTQRTLGIEVFFVFFVALSFHRILCIWKRIWRPQCQLSSLAPREPQSTLLKPCFLRPGALHFLSTDLPIIPKP